MRRDTQGRAPHWRAALLSLSREGPEPAETMDRVLIGQKFFALADRSRLVKAILWGYPKSYVMKQDGAGGNPNSTM